MVAGSALCRALVIHCSLFTRAAGQATSGRPRVARQLEGPLALSVVGANLLRLLQPRLAAEQARPHRLATRPDLVAESALLVLVCGLDVGLVVVLVVGAVVRVDVADARVGRRRRQR